MGEHGFGGLDAGVGVVGSLFLRVGVRGLLACGGGGLDLCRDVLLRRGGLLRVRGARGEERQDESERLRGERRRDSARELVVERHQSSNGVGSWEFGGHMLRACDCEPEKIALQNWRQSGGFARAGARGVT
jgi:hypothetical protein